jgi:replicative DNA helicase
MTRNASKVSIDTLDAVLRRIVREEYPAATHLPPPSDLEAEAVVLCAMIEGHFDGAPLTHHHFYAETHRVLFAVVSSLLEFGAVPTDERILYTTERLGFVAPLLHVELDVIRNSTPTMFRPAPYVDRILATARRRRALDEAETACALLRSGAADATDNLTRAVEALSA